MRVAWEMWGFGPARSFEWNPHFFHYPSLTIYLHVLLQAILYAAMKAAGAVVSAIDFQAIYLTDPTAFVLAGRALNVAFAAATVAALFALARRAGGVTAGAVAAGLLALNAFHVAQSRLVAVDVPLAFLVTAGLLACVRAMERPTRRRFVEAGIVMGLAASTKYTGAMLALPLAAAWWQGRRRVAAAGKDGGGRGGGAPSAKPADLLLALAVAGGVFAATSPFVLLDYATFRAQFTYEWRHMHVGHFGVDASSSWAYYADALRRILGWPMAILALGGGIHLGIVRRVPWAIVVGLFAVVSAGSMGSWAMKADRYLLPAVPAAIALGAGWLVALLDLARVRGSLRTAIALAAALLVAVPPALGIAGQLRDAGDDTRTLAKRWIEENVPAGAYIVMENYGPELVGPITLVGLDPELAAALRERSVFFALQTIPMSQADPEFTDRYYDPALYRIADYVVITSDIRDRYEAEPERFARQVAFYGAVESGMERAKEFMPGQNPGPEIVVYRNPAHGKPFAEREQVEEVAPLAYTGAMYNGEEAFFYYNQGLNLEQFGFGERAIDAYLTGIRYPGARRGVLRNLVMGAVRGLAARGRIRDALEVLDVGTAQATDPSDRDVFARVKEQILAQVGGR